MSLIPDKLFGINTGALDMWQHRSEVLANNLANADTPGYLARDVDFKKVLAGAAAGNLALETTGPGHLGGASSDAGGALAYRVPTQPSMDGNTVDEQAEQADFAATGVHYQASLSFITAQIHMLRTAITEGQS